MNHFNPPIFWWIKQVCLTLLSILFLAFGIQVLVSSYDLDEPFSFVLTFFASNLIILISAVLIIGFVYRMMAVRKQSSGEPTEESNDLD